MLKPNKNRINIRFVLVWTLPKKLRRGIRLDKTEELRGDETDINPPADMPAPSKPAC